jgi:hypothetical protein
LLTLNQQINKIKRHVARKCIKFGRKVEGMGTLGKKDVDGRIILKWILKIEWEAMDWIHLAQDRDLWRVLVYMVMQLRVSENTGSFLTK